MRRLAMTMAGLASAAGALAAIPQQPRAMPPATTTPLCRRAAAMPALAPEPVVRTQQAPRGRGGVVPPMMASPAPPLPPLPPPPPSPPPAPADAAGAADMVVTATRVESRSAPSRSSVVALPPIVSPPAIVAAPSPMPGGSAFAPRAGGRQPQAGLLTAGEHDDLLNPELYRRYVDTFLAGEALAGVPRVDTGRVLTIAVQDAAGAPVPFAEVTLTCADGNTLTLATVADGTAAFFPDLDVLGTRVKVDVASAGRRAAGRAILIADAPGAIRQAVTLAGGAAPVRRFDLALVVDCTGSMGDELTYLQAELRAILARLAQAHPGIDMRVALVAYRDTGDDYVTRTFGFTPVLASAQANLAAQSAGGGGDLPEAVEQAMARAAALDWRPGAVKSLLFVADAPPHADDVAATWKAAEALRAKRVQIVPVAASGVDAGAEYIMRAMAAATQSRYLFLTDDSGIGNPHAPPAIDCYLVTRLDAAVTRVLDGQLSGRRIEPNPGEVIRSVGSYDAGRCRLPPSFSQRQ